MSAPQTPKKVVPRGRKPNPECVNDFCRLCHCPLKLKFGNFEKTSYVSSENLFKPNKECNNRTLFQLLTEVNISIERDKQLSERVCRPCGRKIRNASSLIAWLKSAVNDNVSSSSCQEKAREKRQLPTTVTTPERSPQVKKQPKANATSGDKVERIAKRSLFHKESAVAAKQAKSTDETDEKNSRAAAHITNHLAAMNIEQLVSEKTSMQVKVIITNPNGRVEQINRFHDKTKSLIINLAKKKWETVANVIYKHPLLQSELIAPLRRCVAKEFKEYCRDSSESMLKHSNPVDLETFSNKFLVCEVRNSCPLWEACVSGACNASSNPGSIKTKHINTIALASAMVARCRNQRMSAVAYRISALLFHSGAKYEDITRLYKLSVCMSPEMIIAMQRKMGESCERKLLHWKTEIEKNKKARLLLDEVKEKQVCSPNAKENDMELEVEIDFSKENISKCSAFDVDAYDHCKNVLDAVQKDDNCPVNDDSLVLAANFLSYEKLPLYK